MTTLAARLSRAMQDAGITQADLVRATGASSPSVSNWVNGRTKNLKGRNLVITAQLLGVSEAWLANGCGPMHRKLAEGWPFQSVTRDEYESLNDEQRQHLEESFSAAVQGYISKNQSAQPRNIHHVAEHLNLGKNPLEVLETETAVLTRDGEVDESKTEDVAQRHKS